MENIYSMDGITILNVIYHNNPHVGLMRSFLFLLIVGTIILLIGFSNAESKKIIIGSILLLISVASFSGAIHVGKENAYNTYECTISENTLFSTVLEKYEIVSQRGLIYELKERE